MPLGPDVRYRVKTTKKGKKVRLAFKGNRVVESKNLSTGAKHTPAEFAADRRRRRGGLADHMTALRSAGKFRAS